MVNQYGSIQPFIGSASFWTTKIEGGGQRAGQQQEDQGADMNMNTTGQTAQPTFTEFSSAVISQILCLSALSTPENLLLSSWKSYEH